MFVIQLTYLVPLSEVDKYLQAHREFLDYYYKQGLLLVSGPMKPRTGGIIIAATTDREYLESIFKKDPYYLAEIAEYQFIEFTPVNHRAELKEFIQKMEGKLC
ncbi:YciI family protein [Fluoribacter dumoffii]|uniref:YciI-like protein n=1 Tax=Fluoribacter dumoffii TaxID=463 RepID=A0A377GEZ3_9GAMM|nr:YciI family protein [Fluoribacter dumoffii]KTC91368.1 YCII domain-containing protein [Fluoribacter dumoffii NY 23]MCW8387503.1 YciI family protein [Fluoribacter dumoffii]MCW8416989.1 YciI family protein [Fluoribacter dumoffii]MCW8455171.1 YciI family protein [Fluoribacter dumoffii]MCW8460752.1 YciI family protein [Fluoribacter dumoffii]